MHHLSQQAIIAILKWQWKKATLVDGDVKRSKAELSWKDVYDILSIKIDNIIAFTEYGHQIKEFSIYWLPKSKVLLEVGAKIPV